MMIKKVKKIGNSLGITFSKEEQAIWGIKKDSIIECKDIVVTRPEDEE